MASKDQVPGLPHRLKELRLELGWSLADVLEKVGVAQRGVVSNWEATNQRRRTPPLPTLLILQRWYGASLDYMIGHPDAERDSPAVKAGKQALRAALLQMKDLDRVPPSDRARLAIREAIRLKPEAFFDGRIAAYLLMTMKDYEALMADRVWSDTALARLSQLLGIHRDWFYMPQPAKVLEYVE
ncbi:MAG: helix-turn-helix domain-containing protein [Bacillota bacterium]